MSAEQLTQICTLLHNMQIMHVTATVLCMLRPC